MDHEFKLDEICILKRNHNHEETLVRISDVSIASDGWFRVHLMWEQPRNKQLDGITGLPKPPKNGYFVNSRDFIPIREISDLIKDLDSVGLF